MASIPRPPRPRKDKSGRLRHRTRWYDDGGHRHDKTFGYCDQVTAREAKARFQVWLTQWTHQDRVRNPQATEATYKVSELCTDFLEFARKSYVKNGEITSTVWQVAYAMQALTDTLGERCASSVEGPEIAAVRDSMIKATDKDGEEYVRSVKTVNGRLYLIKQAFKWARERGWIAKDNLFDIWQVSYLKAGRCEATAPTEITPVDEHWVAVTKPYAAAPVRTMIELQWLSGMRPGEACIMRGRDIDTSGQVWLYTPSSHKMEHKGRIRIIALGPKCQALLKPFLEAAGGTDAYLFSPAAARAEQMAEKRKNRKSKVWPSHQRRYEEQRAESPARPPGDRYTVASYRRAIHYACLRADKISREAGGDGVPFWNPNQLRHAAATRLNKRFKLEDVSVTLGHADMATTRIYALPDVSRAIRVAKRAG